MSSNKHGIEGKHLTAMAASLMSIIERTIEEFDCGGFKKAKIEGENGTITLILTKRNTILLDLDKLDSSGNQSIEFGPKGGNIR